MAVSLALVVVTLAVAWLFWKVVRGLIPLLRCMSVPALPGDRLIGGHFWMYAPGETTLKERREIFRKVLRSNMKIARFNFAFRLPFNIVLLHPDVVNKVYNTNVEAKTFFPWTSFTPLMGKSLVLAGGARWRRNRGLLKQAFGRQEIRFFFETFRVLARELVTHWEKKLARGDDSHVADAGGTMETGEVRVKVDGYLTRLTMESILRCAFACQEPEWVEKTPRYGMLIDQFLKLHMIRFNNPLNLSDFFFYNFTSGGKKLLELTSTTLKVARAILEDRKKARNRGSGEISDDQCMVDILLQARDPESGEGMSEDDMVYECNLFLFAGYDTSRLALTWLFHLLANHPEEQHRCQEEVDLAFGDRDDIEWEDLSNLPYLTCCAKEALRMYPPLNGAPRKLPEEVVLDGYTIPKGMIVSDISVALHYNPEFWEKPDEFNPDHFSAEQEAKRPQGVYRPFSTGLRRCLGENFAMEEIKTTAAYLLRRFDFLPDPDHKVIDYMQGFLIPKEGVKIILKLRE